MQQQSDQQPHQTPHHTRISFHEPKEPDIFFNSCFDSGNMSKVNRNSYDHYSIWTASDAEGTANQGYPKSWFYFQAGGFHNRKVTFSIHRVHFLWSVSKRPHLYRPVIRTIQENNESDWQRLPHPVISLTLNEEEELVLKFDFFFSKQIKSVKFAFIYPFSYEDQRIEVMRLKKMYEEEQDPEVFFKQYQLIKSYQQRTIDLVVISSHEGKDGFQTIKYDQHFDLKEKMVRFRNNKPIIFVSARVHPIETPSSFCMKGIIDFLLDKKDYRAHLLRKYFVFVLVPMLNPDGVSNGYCRMDHLNQNLNRYYKTPDPIKQPPCYAVRKLCEHYQKDNRMFMYLDLHAHPAVKGNFMFGNAIYDFIEQVESQVFPKILSQNCINFEFDNCIFSRRHMKAKDRNEDMNKQGCGRVVLYKDFGIPHAYTLECGYHMNSYNNKLQPQRNSQNRYIVRYKLTKSNEKVYENIQRLYSAQMLHKVEQTIKKHGQSSNVDDEIRGTAKSMENEYGMMEKEDKDTVEFNRMMKHAHNHHGLNKTKLQPGKSHETSTKPKPHAPSNSSYDGYDIFQHTTTPYDTPTSPYYTRQLPTYTPESYQNLGRNILITILDIFNKNPFSRSIDLNERRKQIAQKQSKLDRFRKEQAGIRNKMKNIVELIEEQFYSPWIKRNVFVGGEVGGGEKGNNEKGKRNKTLQFQIVKSSQNRVRNSTKEHMQINQIDTKRHLVFQSEVIKTSIGNNNQPSPTHDPPSLFHKPCSYPQKQKPDEYQNRNTLLAKKIKSFKSKQQPHKGPLKELTTSKQPLQPQQSTKKPLPTTQNIITLEQEIKVMRNEGLCLSTKIIKHPSYNMASLRMRNFMMQGNNAFGSVGNHSIGMGDRHGLGHQAYSLGNDGKK